MPRPLRQRGAGFRSQPTRTSADVRRSRRACSQARAPDQKVTERVGVLLSPGAEAAAANVSSSDVFKQRIRIFLTVQCGRAFATKSAS